MSDHSFAIKHIQAILDEMRALEPMPKIGSDAYHADHEEWKTRRDRLNETEREAEIYALLTVPDEIAVLLEQVRREWHRARGLTRPGDKSEETPTNA